MKLFISYARVDKPLCKQIVERLQDVHEVWYDQRLHAGQEWWGEIQKRLNWCEGFVYLLSPESVASTNCQREHALAVEAGKHIFPVLIQARTTIPESLSHIQYADLSEGVDTIITLLNALTVAERHQPGIRVFPPKVTQSSPSPSQALAQVADALNAQNYDNAMFIIKETKETLGKKLNAQESRMLESLLAEAEAALEKQTYLREAEREYAPIRELVQREVTRALGCREFAEFRRDFPDYDPDKVADTCAEAISPLPAQRSGEELRVRAILPPPFAWIEIPDTIGKKWHDTPYRIAKYPITNAQYALFIESGGYAEKRWWTEAGWQWREKEGWILPNYWDNTKWGDMEYPVVGVSWYEAVAFCLWLSEVSSSPIMLPTEAQWQYAAQGDEGWLYPWGNELEANRCNTLEAGIGKITSVHQYEKKGDSLFGVVDMVGNVWEWCLTDYHAESNDIDSIVSRRTIRGGSWLKDRYSARAAVRSYLDPSYRVIDSGFRVCTYEHHNRLGPDP